MSKKISIELDFMSVLQRNPQLLGIVNLNVIMLNVVAPNKLAPESN